MTTSDRDRKLLWGRSGNRCAICRIVLTPASTLADPDSVIGDEAHIVARSAAGPRGSETLIGSADGYDNLILLCKNHHGIVDTEPVGTYTADHLRAVKAEHEVWVAAQLSSQITLPPTRVRPDPDAPELFLGQLLSGRDVWAVIAQASACKYDGPEEPEVAGDVCDLVDSFLDEARDVLDISRDIEDHGRSNVRETQRSLGAHLDVLLSHGIAVFGGREHMIIEGGYTPPAPFVVAHLLAVQATDPRIATQ